MEAIAAMIGSETAASTSTSEEAEREIQIVEIFNQDVAISGVALAARGPGPPCRREHNKFISPSLRGRCHF